MWYRFNRLLFRLWFRVQVPYRVEGRHHEPPVPFIVIANHASAADIPLVALALQARVAFMAKEELARLVGVRLWIRSLGSFFVRRDQADRTALRTALDRLARGWAIGVFAEGTRSVDGRLQPFQQGAAYLALRAGVPVLPLGIGGSHRIMPKGARWPRRAPVVIRLGPPMAVPRVEGRLSHALVRTWTARFEAAVAALLPGEQQPLRPLTAPAAATAARSGLSAPAATSLGTPPSSGERD